MCRCFRFNCLYLFLSRVNKLFHLMGLPRQKSDVSQFYQTNIRVELINYLKSGLICLHNSSCPLSRRRIKLNCYFFQSDNSIMEIDRRLFGELVLHRDGCLKNNKNNSQLNFHDQIKSNLQTK